MKAAVANYLNNVGEAIGAEFYFVGGTVRDSLLGLHIDDWDCVARGLNFDDLIERMSIYGDTNTTGEQFNVIRHYPNNSDIPPLEIALPRKEHSNGVGPKDFEARYDANMPIEEDLARRDYTINSIAERCLTGELIDPYGGRGDLERGCLRMLYGDSAEDDPLRIVRGVRFLAKFGFEPTADTDEQLRAHVHLIYTVSRERFQKELLDLIVAPHVDTALRYMQDIGALAEIFPELERCVGCTQNKYHDYDVWEHTVRVVKNTPSNDPYVRLAALLHDVAKPVVKWIDEEGEAHFYRHPDHPHSGAHEQVGAVMAYQILDRLRFSHFHCSRVGVLVREHMFIQGDKIGPRTARRFLSRLAHSPGGVEANLAALFQIREGDLRGGKAKLSEELLRQNQRFLAICREELGKEAAFKVTDLAINGHDVMALGLRGPQVGKLLKTLLDKVIDDPSLNSEEQLLELAGQELLYG